MDVNESAGTLKEERRRPISQDNGGSTHSSDDGFCVCVSARFRHSHPLTNPSFQFTSLQKHV
jgi:hypothetical protein